MHSPSKNVLITGGADGLGKALARRHRAAGDAVTILDVDLVRGEATSAEIGARFLAADLATLDFDSLDLGAAPFDCVILNAGISAFGNFATIPWCRQQAVLDVNFTGHVRLLQQLLARNLIADGARLGFILSAAVFTPIPVAATYAASKAALKGFARALEPSLKHRRISVSLVYPGQMRTAHQAYYDNAEPRFAVDPDLVASRVFRGLNRRRRSIYPDWMSLAFRIVTAAVPWAVPHLIYRVNRKRFAEILFPETAP